MDFFSHILSVNVKNIYGDQLDCIFGAEDYRKGKCDFKNVAVTAIDKDTLSIRLNYPCNYFWIYLLNLYIHLELLITSL